MKKEKDHAHMDHGAHMARLNQTVPRKRRLQISFPWEGSVVSVLGYGFCYQDYLVCGREEEGRGG